MHNNWYKAAKIEQEAGLKEMIPAALLMALIAVMSGSGIMNAVRKYNVSHKEIESALQNRAIIDEISKHPEYFENLPQEPIQEDNEGTSKVSQETLINENIIARTLYHEIRSKSPEERMAIASAIYNRSDGTTDSIINVIKKPYQFSCWNKADANDWTNMKQGRGRVWEDSVAIAHSMVNGTFQSVGKWNHYYNPRKADPYWAYLNKERTKRRPFETIGEHRFLIL